MAVSFFRAFLPPRCDNDSRKRVLCLQNLQHEGEYPLILGGILQNETVEGSRKRHFQSDTFHDIIAWLMG
jgi:hypothetical protein